VEVPREVTGVDGSSHTCTSEFRSLRYRRLENQKFGIMSSEVASSETPPGRVSKLTDHRVSGIRDPSVQPLNSRSHDFRFPDKSKKGIARENCGSRFPDREIEEP
jgi:hypothetical protein